MLGWPRDTAQSFIEAYRKGKDGILPNISHPKLDLSATIHGLKTLRSEIPRTEPIGCFLSDTAESYLQAADLLNSRGTPEFTEISKIMYGAPGDKIRGSELSNLDAAEHFVRATQESFGLSPLLGDDFCLRPEAVRDDLQKRVNEFFVGQSIEIRLDPSLSAKAAAGADRISIRGGSPFSRYDLDQLWSHEALVHTLTALNGRSQPHFKSFSLGAPRATATQEGLATFSELLTGVIDLDRLKRIALRIRAIAIAESGGDFMDVFRFMLDQGQTENESFWSAQRVFRGGNVKGGSFFTKDVVYLEGLISTHTFFRWCMHTKRLDTAVRLFAGKMTFEDAVLLGPTFERGWIKPPKFQPPWLQNYHCLAAHLAFSIFTQTISLDRFQEVFLEALAAT